MVPSQREPQTLLAPLSLKLPADCMRHEGCYGSPAPHAWVGVLRVHGGMQQALEKLKEGFQLALKPPLESVLLTTIITDIPETNRLQKCIRQPLLIKRQFPSAGATSCIYHARYYHWVKLSATACACPLASWLLFLMRSVTCVRSGWGGASSTSGTDISERLYHMGPECSFNGKQLA